MKSPLYASALRKHAKNALGDAKNKPNTKRKTKTQDNKSKTPKRNIKEK